MSGQGHLRPVVFQGVSLDGVVVGEFAPLFCLLVSGGSLLVWGSQDTGRCRLWGLPACHPQLRREHLPPQQQGLVPSVALRLLGM